jgi:hypothetical protein
MEEFEVVEFEYSSDAPPDHRDGFRLAWLGEVAE